MILNRVNIISKKDGNPLSVMYYEIPDPKGIVQIVHGMCEHKERYKEFIHYLGKQGYMVIIHDHRGHGLSVKKKRDLGYFGDHGAEDVVDDVYQVHCWIRLKYPYLPIYLLGHSMGSLIGRIYLQKYKKTIAGLILCGSPSKNNLLPVGQCLVSVLEKIKGPFYRSRLIQGLVFDAFNRKIKQPQSPHDWICSDERVVRLYDQDPFCNFTYTLNGYQTLFSLMKQTYDKKKYHPKRKHLPILMIGGKEDPCIDGEKKFNQAIRVLEEAGYDRITSHLYPKMRHEILNEKHHEIVYRDIVSFLNRIQVK